MKNPESKSKIFNGKVFEGVDNYIIDVPKSNMNDLVDDLPVTRCVPAEIVDSVLRNFEGKKVSVKVTIEVEEI